MPRISVIMPSLNVARYYEQCIESVLSQTYTDIEILCVDAGSTDGTAELIDKYAHRDNRVRRIDSDVKSYGYQINLGVAESRGDYIGIVETDDYIEADAYEKLITAIEQTDCDYVKGNARFLDERNPYDTGGKYIPLNNCGVDRLPYGEIVLDENPEIEYGDRFIWLGLYKKSLMREIKLNESAGAAYQDIDFSLQLHTKAKKGLYIDKIVYNYRTFAIGSSTINHKAFKYIADEYDYCRSILEKTSGSIRTQYINKLVDQTRNRYLTMVLSGSFWDEQIGEMNRVVDILKCEMENGYILEESLNSDLLEFVRYMFQSPRSVYDCYSMRQANKLAELEQLVAAIRGKKIVLFGCGKRSAFGHALVERICDSEVVAYTDNNCDNLEALLRGKPVMEVEEACRVFPEAIFLITSKKYAAEINSQLLQNGVENSRIVVMMVDTDNGLLEMQL